MSMGRLSSNVLVVVILAVHAYLVIYHQPDIKLHYKRHKLP